jgi:hypothetical protein
MLLTFPIKDLLVKKAYQEPLFDVALLISNYRSLADWSLTNTHRKLGDCQIKSRSLQLNNRIKAY